MMLGETLRREEAGLQRDSCDKFVVELFLREGRDVITLYTRSSHAHTQSSSTHASVLETRDRSIIPVTSNHSYSTARLHEAGKMIDNTPLIDGLCTQ